MKKIKLTKRDIKTLHIETYVKGGFAVWINERVKIGKIHRNIRHWIIDGSNLHEDGLIRLGFDIK